MNTEDLAVMRTGAEIAGMLPAIKADAEAAQKAIVNSVMSKLHEGGLDPDFAQQKWIEYVAYSRMLQRFESKVRLGVTVGEQNAVSLEIQNQLGV